MASTFTLKRKTYTEWDYHNEISDYGFREGFDYACEKMFGATLKAQIYKSIKNSPEVIDWFGTRGVDMDDVGKAIRGLTVDTYGKNFHKGFLSRVNNEKNRILNGGQQVKGKFPPGNNPSSPALQQRAASFIGKGYLY